MVLNVRDLFTPTPKPTPGPTPRPAVRPAGGPPPLPRAGLSYSLLKQAMFMTTDPRLAQALRREARVAFNRLAWPDQLSLIVDHSREQLHAADLTLGTYWHKRSADDATPSAASVWRCYRTEKFIPEASVIQANFPGLRNTASAESRQGQTKPTPVQDLTACLKGLYEFWAVKMYCYGPTGAISQEIVLTSRARLFGPREFAEIDNNTGLPGLGARIKAYADFLAAIADRLTYR